MNTLYIGPYTQGTTSQQRGEQLKTLLELIHGPIGFRVINTHVPLNATPKLWRSIGFRLKKGPLIDAINRYIIQEIDKGPIADYDLIWVDKAVFITEKTTQTLRRITSKLIHYTPDMAFYANRSSHFYRSLAHYDYVVTTKSAEIDQYLSFLPKEKLIVTTQGYDKHLHRPMHTFEEKEGVVSFVGLCEPYREKVIQLLLNHSIHVKLAGKGWKPFVKANRNSIYLYYHGESVFGEEYVRFISSSQMCLGLLSKKFPELHTTRTFEIPACGTALLTERNSEIAQYFGNDEVIFYHSPDDLIKQIRFYLSNPQALMAISTKGGERVIANQLDYESLLTTVCAKAGLITQYPITPCN